MKTTIVLKLLEPTNRKKSLIERNIKETHKNRISISNKLVNRNNVSTKDFNEKIPSAVMNQNIREVKALRKMFIRNKEKDSDKKNLVFKANQPLCYNNQNYKVDEEGFVSFPLFDNKSTRIWMPVVKNNKFNYLIDLLDNHAKLGKASLFKRNNDYFFAITLTLKKPYYKEDETIMGVDIGLNQLAVVSIKNKEEELNRKFFNGKEAGFIRRKSVSLRKELGKKKKINKIIENKDKESRWMTNKNHKISREIVNLAVQEEVSVLVMENLKNIRKSAFSLKRSDRNLNSWAFFELQQFIEYKALASGIKVEYIEPKYTSQKCNSCGKIKKSNRKKTSTLVVVDTKSILI